MPCNCKDWKPNIEIINGYISMQSHMAWGNKNGYEGKPFVFCPWCGSKLVAEEIKSVPQIPAKVKPVKPVCQVIPSKKGLLNAKQIQREWDKANRKEIR